MFIVNVLSCSLTTISWQPATQQAPIPRATTAACEVIPPRAVKIPSAAYIPSISSGDVSSLTSTTFSPFCALSTASAAVNAILPQAAPGDAGKPLAIGFAFLITWSSNVGCNKASNCFGSIFNSASSVEIIPSSTKSQAIFSAARAVLLPLRVCSIYNLPRSIVNSISCISL